MPERAEGPATGEARDVLDAAASLIGLAGMTTPEALNKVQDERHGETLFAIQRLRRVAIDLRRLASSLDESADELRGAMAMTLNEHDERVQAIQGESYPRIGEDREVAPSKGYARG